MARHDVRVRCPGQRCEWLASLRATQPRDSPCATAAARKWRCTLKILEASASARGTGASLAHWDCVQGGGVATSNVRVLRTGGYDRVTVFSGPRPSSVAAHDAESDRSTCAEERKEGVDGRPRAAEARSGTLQAKMAALKHEQKLVATALSAKAKAQYPTLFLADMRDEMVKYKLGPAHLSPTEKVAAAVEDLETRFLAGTLKPGEGEEAAGTEQNPPAVDDDHIVIPATDEPEVKINLQGVNLRGAKPKDVHKEIRV